MTISVNRERCASSGNCAFAQPTVFDQDEQDGRVILLRESPSDISEMDLKDVENLCPGQAIKVDIRPPDGGTSA